MKKQKPSSRTATTTRREFLKTSALVAGAGALAARLPLERFAHAEGAGVIRFGLIGCGGRGTGAAVNAMNAGKDVRLVAMWMFSRTGWRPVAIGSQPESRSKWL